MVRFAPSPGGPVLAATIVHLAPAPGGPVLSATAVCLTPAPVILRKKILQQHKELQKLLPVLILPRRYIAQVIYKDVKSSNPSCLMLSSHFHHGFHDVVLPCI